MQLKVQMPYIQMYGVQDNSRNALSHKFIYYPIISPITGRTWLNNNLGAEYSNTNNSFWANNPQKHEQLSKVVSIPLY
jgi:hypothetical protein